MESSPNDLRPERLLEHVAWLRRLAGTLVLDAARADDVTQQTLLEALQRAPARVGHPRAWLATAARNFARAWGRGDTRRQSLERATARSEAEPAADEVVARTARHHQVVGAVLALAEPYRTTVLLRFFENQKPGAIAKRTGVPVETVRTRLKRGLELLRAELVQQRGNWAAVLVGLIDSRVHAAASRLLLAKAGAAGAIAGGVAVSIKTKIAIGVAVVACAVVAIVELQRTSGDDRRRGGGIAAHGAAAADAGSSDTTTTTEATRANVADGAGASDRAMIRVLVTDEQGAPVVAARVGVLVPEAPHTIGERDRESAPFEFLSTATATTGASGECTLPVPDLRGSKLVDVGVTADRFAPACWLRARGGDTISFTLERAGTLRGVVRDLAGAPIAGAMVAMVVEKPRLLRIATQSDTEGSYALAPYSGPQLNLGRGQFEATWITVRAPGFVPENLLAYEVLRQTGEREWSFDAWLGRGATVRGRVVERGTRAPIAGAAVWIPQRFRERGEDRFRTRTAADGRFLFAHLPAWGVHPVGVLSGLDDDRVLLGSVCASAEGGGRDTHELDVPEEGEELTCELDLGEVGGVRGRVVDSQGQPVAGVSVYPCGSPSILWSERGDGRATPVERTLTDEDGRYELRDLLITSGASTNVVVNADFERSPGAALASANRSVQLAAGRIVYVDDLIVDPPEGLAIRVLDESGIGVPDATVHRWILDADGKPTDEEFGRVGPTGLLFLQSLRSRGAAATRVSIAVDAAGFAFLVRELDAAVKRVDLTLAPEHHLRGRLLDVDGRPGQAHVVAVPATMPPERFAAALRVDDYFKGPASNFAHVFTSAGSARFVLRGLGPGPWHVAAFRKFEGRENSVVVVANVRDDSQEVEVVLPRSAEPWVSVAEANRVAEGFGTVELQLTRGDSGGPAHRGGDARLERDGYVHYAHGVAPGRYSFEWVPAGTWELCLSLPGAAHDRRKVTVEAGRSTSITVTVPTVVEARGRIDLADLPGFRGGEIHFESDDGGGRLAGALEIDGTYRVRDLVDGKRYRLWLMFGGPDGDTQYWVAEGEARPAHEWVGGGSPRLKIAGAFVVRFEHLDSLDGAMLHVVDGEGRERVVVRLGDSDREYTGCLEIGTYTVRLEVPGCGVRHVTQTLDAARRTMFDLPYEPDEH